MHDPVAHPEQESDLEPRSVRRVFFVGVAVVLVSALFAAWGVLEVVGRAGTIRSPVPPAPLAEIAQRSDIEQQVFDLEARGLQQKHMQRRELESYGWVDPSRGLVRIPIDRAMPLVGEALRAQQAGLRPLPIASDLERRWPARGSAPRSVTRGESP